MKPDDFSRPTMLDEQIEALARELEQRQRTRRDLADAPDLRLAQDIRQAYQAETNEDKRSLERVLSRLVANEAADQPKVISFPQVNTTGKRMPAMQTNTMNSSPQHKTKGRWGRRIGLIAAVLCLALLVGGFLSVLNATHANHTTGVGSSVTAKPTPQPTLHPASLVITKAVLTNSHTGNSEGLGPDLAGVTPATHFTTGQQFWVFFLVNNTTEGTVTAKWYENGHLYKTASQDLAPSGVSPTSSRNSPGSSPVESNFGIVYNQSAQGKVELYWNGQLELTLFFTVSA